MTNQQFTTLLDSTPPNLSIQILDTLIVMRNKLSEYQRIALSYSGGSDSDIMLDIVELVKPEDSGEVSYVFFDTGLEWYATLHHISKAEQKYNINIERRTAKVTIPVACARHGVPFLTKHVSDMAGRLQRHNFDWADTSEGATVEKYGKCKSALDWFFDRKMSRKEGGKSMFSIRKHLLLKEFMSTHPPGFAISDKCCDYAKKNVAKDFDRMFRPDLKIIGMRQAEGGRRVGSRNSCMSLPTATKRYAGEPSKAAQYHPLWFWTDADKEAYKAWRNIRYSDCYEVWGFKRTGCVGCPCASASVEQLEQARQCEPNKVKAAYAVFGKAYEYREEYNRFKKLT